VLTPVMRLMRVNRVSRVGAPGVLVTGYAASDERARVPIGNAQTGAPLRAWLYCLVEPLCSSLASPAPSAGDVLRFAAACDARKVRVVGNERRPGVTFTTLGPKLASRGSPCGLAASGRRERAEKGVLFKGFT